MAKSTESESASTRSPVLRTMRARRRRAVSVQQSPSVRACGTVAVGDARPRLLELAGKAVTLVLGADGEVAAGTVTKGRLLRRMHHGIPLHDRERRERERAERNAMTHASDEEPLLPPRSSRRADDVLDRVHRDRACRPTRSTGTIARRPDRASCRPRPRVVRPLSSRPLRRCPEGCRAPARARRRRRAGVR